MHTVPAAMSYTLHIQRVLAPIFQQIKSATTDDQTSNMTLSIDWLELEQKGGIPSLTKTERHGNRQG